MLRYVEHEARPMIKAERNRERVLKKRAEQEAAKVEARASKARNSLNQVSTTAAEKSFISQEVDQTDCNNPRLQELR